MSVTAWRVFKPQHANTAFTGAGARLYGGRWNSKGYSVVYTAGSCALAALELLVQLQRHEILQSYVVAQVSFANDLVQPVDVDALPTNWAGYPAPRKIKAIGNRWIVDKTSAVLRVPSTVIQSEFNYLLNPEHEDFAQIAFGEALAFAFDPRLVK